MALFKARYGGICGVCRLPFSPSLLIWAEKGKPPVHAQCKGKAPKVPTDTQAALSEAESKRRFDKLAARYLWMRRNPRPDLEYEIAQMGGPRRAEIAEPTDEERRWHDQQYQKVLELWLAIHPEIKAKRDAALAEWERRKKEQFNE